MRSAPPTIELYEAEFDEACRSLFEACKDFRPQTVLGIATGGVFVARAMQPHWPEPTPNLVEVSIRRPSTAVKERLSIGRLLARLPLRVANVLRWLEVEARERALGRKALTDGEAGVIEMQAGTAELLAAGGRVLVVDDTVDSGRTLHRAVELVAGQAPDAHVRTAVLTSTFRSPPVKPDYLLYERTLLRFPWSLDS